MRWKRGHLNNILVKAYCILKKVSCAQQGSEDKTEDRLNDGSIISGL